MSRLSEEGYGRDGNQVRVPASLAPRGTPKADLCRRAIEELKAAQAPRRMELALQLQRELMALDRQFDPLQVELQRIAKDQRETVAPWQSGTSASPSPCDWSATRHLLHGERGWFTEVCWLRRHSVGWIIRVPTTLELPAKWFEYMTSGTMEVAKMSADRRLRSLGFRLLDTDDEVTQARASW